MGGLLEGLLTDHNGVPSSKRLVGVVGSFVLFAVLVVDALAAVRLAFDHKQPIIIDGMLVGVVAGLVMGALGLTTIEKRPAEKAQAEIAVRRATGAVPAVPEGQ